MLSILIGMGIAIVFTGLGVGIGRATKKTPLPPPKQEPKILRKGIIQFNVAWREHTGTKWSRKEGRNVNVFADRSSKVTAILHEMEVVASQSKVVIHHIDDAPNSHVRKFAREKIGDYIKTSKVEWDQLLEKAEEKDSHAEFDKYLQTLETEISQNRAERQKVAQ